ncbi:vomeromodulin-like [Lepus europaeus]|uniref:vomeromodulin-like n=1 Tax=Lepus europaeus TaxID=9983 RepID=UPI002B49254C|nr:vomeromodulin-like [Lepus europaeus]
MLTLWALVLTLGLQARALDLLEAAPVIDNLPVAPLAIPINALEAVPLRLGPRRRPPTQRDFTSKKRSARSGSGKCIPVAEYFLSKSRLNDYLNNTLPAEIEKLFKCKQVNLVGVVGTLVSTLSTTKLLSALDLGSLLSLGGGGLGDILGKGGSGNSQALDVLGGLLPLGDKGLGGLLPLGDKGLGGLLSGKKGKGTLRRLLDGTGLSSLQQPLDDVLGKVTELKESTKNVVNKALPPDVSNALSGLLGGLDLNELLLGLQVQEVTVDSMNSTTAKDGIHILATTTAVIGGKGLAGPVISLVGFHVYSDVTLTIGISTNDTQCVNLQVQNKDIQVNKVTLQLVETYVSPFISGQPTGQSAHPSTHGGPGDDSAQRSAEKHQITDVLPVSVPVPLGDVVTKLLSVELNKNVEEADSCDIVLSGFNDCKNSTGLFRYHVRAARFSPKGLSIFYCAEALFDNKAVPVPGRLLPPHPKSANVSLTLSRTLLDAPADHIAKQSTFKIDNLEASITRIRRGYQSNDTSQVTYWSSIKKDGESFATGESKLTIWHDSKISKDKLVSEVKLVRSDFKVTPPEATDEVRDVMKGQEKKFWSVLVEILKAWNIPAGVTSNHLNNAKVNVTKSNDLQAAN